MNKAELIEEIMKSGEYQSKAHAERALGTMLDGILAGLKKDEKVQLVGFGTFNVKHRAARDGINPATKQPVKIPAKTTVRFKAGQGLNDSLGGKGR